MASPRTLPALRAAVARVLQARGEAADALVCDARRAPRGYPRGVPWYATIRAQWESTGKPPSWVGHTWAATETIAIELAWEYFVEALSCDTAAHKGAVADAEERLRKAAAALAVAREIGGEE